MGALALGAQRLLPALQQIYTGWATLKSHSAAIKSVVTMLNLPVNDKQSRIPMPFTKNICFESVSFMYDDTSPEVLNSLNVEFKVGERVGIIGTTGSGKSTLVDMLMGLLKPTSGRILVDNQDIHDLQDPVKLDKCRLNIAHVPQTIYLSDSTIAENIAFGVPWDSIDMDRVRFAAKKAQIDHYINSCTNGYLSLVGESGIRLSGGQRQRIGIARALYKKASVLVFDEATSALDNTTENNFINSLNSLNNDMLIVMIAHRLSTVENCDRIIQLEKGRIVMITLPMLS